MKMLENIKDRQKNLSVNIKAVLAWISSTSRFLSNIGIAITHPHKKLRISKDEAVSYLQVSSAEVTAHTPAVALLLDLLDEYFRGPCKVESAGRFFYDDCAGFDIEKEWRASSHFANNAKNIFLTKTEGSSYITDECRDNPEAVQDLLLVKNHWDQLRVQLKVLFFQIRASGDFTSAASNCQQKAALSSSKGDRKLLQAVGEKTTKSNSCNNLCGSRLQYLGLVDHFLLIKMEDFKNETEEQTVGKLKRNKADVDSSQRDEGYSSKLEITVEDGFLLADSTSLECTVASSQGKAGCNNKEKLSDGLIRDMDAAEVKESNRGEFPLDLSCSGFDSYEWDAIHRAVERFSDNTTTLLSWIDELKEIDRESGSAPHKFYYSEAARRSEAMRHINRLYVDVIDDAATLLRDLPSEKTTLLTVLRNIDTQCRRCGIVVGDDFAELSSIKPSFKKIDPKSGFLSSRLRSSLSFSLPFSQTEDSNPSPLCSSSPVVKNERCMSSAKTSSCRSKQICRAASPLLVSDYCGFDSDRLCVPFLNRAFHETCHFPDMLGFDFTSRWQYDSFLAEYESLCEKLETMELLLNKTEYCTDASFGRSFQFSKYTRELDQYRMTKEELNRKANEITCAHPELKSSVLSMMADLNDLWSVLYERLDCDLPYWPSEHLPKEPLQNAPWLFGPRDRFLHPWSTDSYDCWRDERFYSCYDSLMETPYFCRDLPYWDLLRRNVTEYEDRYSPVAACYENDDYFYSLAIARERENCFESLRKSKVPSCRNEFDEIEAEIGRSLFRNKPSESRVPKNRPSTTSAETSKSETVPKRVKFATEEDVSECSDSNISVSASDPLLLREITMDPIELSAYIKQFHQWLKLIEKDVFLLYSSESIGWDPLRVKTLIQSNEERKLKLDEKNRKLRQIMLASEKVLDDHDRSVSEFFLLWSSSMLEQRYLNLTLYTVDMECVLERRAEILSKGTTEHGLSHFVDGAWSDCGEDLRPSVPIEDKDYDIFWLVM